MKILLCSYTFYPNVGGIESMSQTLAQEFLKADHEVVVVTETKNNEPDGFDYQVIRKPSLRDLTGLMRWSDVVFHNNISLRMIAPLLFTRRPLVVAIRTWIRRNDGSTGWQDRLKHLALRRAKKLIANSEAVAQHVRGDVVVIGNAYKNHLFRELHLDRERDLVFVGRLVSDKGADLAIEAVAKLKAQGIRTNLTVIGGGDEEDTLREMVQNHDLQNDIVFTGPLSGEALVQELNRHKIVVIPSRWHEPFGIVALEGIACGCVPVGSDGGGLKDAIGPCGLTFPNGDLGKFVDQLGLALGSDELRQKLRSKAESHLQKHTPESVAHAYLNVLEEAKM